MAGKKLLVADDSLTIQKVIRLALSNEGYEIQTVSNGNEALEQLSLFRPDIVLIDVSLPNKSAFDIKRWVNAQNDMKHIQFVLMSSAFEKVDEAQITHLNFSGQLTKPFDPALLRKILSDVLAAAAPATHSQDIWGSDFKTSGSFDPEVEIKTLTDSTFQLNQPPVTPPPSPLMSSPPAESGTGDFDWSVQEPSLAPPAALQDLGDTTFPVEPSAPPATYFNAPDSMDDMNHVEPEKIIAAPPPPPPSMAQYKPIMMEAPTHLTASSAHSSDMENMIKQQIENTVEQMAKKILPEVAEKIIRAEINRLLSEMG